MSHVIDPARVKHQHLDHQFEALSIAPLQGHAQSTFSLYTLRQCERYQRVVEERGYLFGMIILWVSLDFLHLFCQFSKEDAQEKRRPVVDMHNVCVVRKLYIQIVQNKGLGKVA
jgi:hypothetical protein